MIWKKIIENEKQKDYYQKLEKEINKRYENSRVFPEKQNIFKAFSLTPIENLKVVILGQDPYHGFGQAQGLSFSTPENIKNPPSMINTILTVEESLPKSHHNLGWEIFTDNIIKYVNDNCEGIVFLLWGTPAISKSKLIDIKKHHILSAPHPSPLSSYRGFFGCKHFSKTNEILRNLGKKEIIW